MHSIVDLDNQDFPDTLRINDMTEEQAKKYSIEEVLVRPRIVHGTMDMDYRLAVLFYCKTNDAAVSVKVVSSLINGKKVFCEGHGFGSDKWNNKWDLYQENYPYYVSGIWGAEEVSLPESIVKRSRVDGSLVVAVKARNGQIAEKLIQSRFIPQKRSYLE